MRRVCDVPGSYGRILNTSTAAPRIKRVSLADFLASCVREWGTREPGAVPVWGLAIRSGRTQACL